MNPTRICSIDGCDRKHYGNGLCSMHHQRMRAHGDPLTRKIVHYHSPEEKFQARTRREGDCLIWTGGTNQFGYGRIRIDGRQVQTHRYAWEQANGPIPNGMQVDHTCWNPACCEVSHLRLATPKQNSENLKGARSDSGTGVRGVIFDKRRGTWSARIRHDGKFIHSKSFKSLEEAADAAMKLRAEHFTHSQN